MMVATIKKPVEKFQPVFQCTPLASVHLNELISVCDSWNIPIVEDAAESLGSKYGYPTGVLENWEYFRLMKQVNNIRWRRGHNH